MALDENAGGDRLRFVLTDKTPSSDLQLVCQAPNDEVRQNWITQISSILDMQGDLLRGNSSKCVFLCWLWDIVFAGNCDKCDTSVIKFVNIIRLYLSITYVDAACCCRWSSVVCLSVCVSVMIVSPAKMAEVMEMLFRLWTQVGPRNHVLSGGSISPMQRGQFWGGNGQAVVKYRDSLPWAVDPPF